MLCYNPAQKKPSTDKSHCSRSARKKKNKIWFNKHLIPRNLFSKILIHSHVRPCSKLYQMNSISITMILLNNIRMNMQTQE